MLIEITRDTSISGQPAMAGQVVDAAERDARILLGMGKAIIAAEPAPVISSPEPAPVRGKRQPKPSEP